MATLEELFAQRAAERQQGPTLQSLFEQRSAERAQRTTGAVDNRRQPGESVEAYRARLSATTMATPAGSQEMTNLASSAMTTPPPAPPPRQVGTVEDVLRSFAAGVGRGVTGLADTAAAALPQNMVRSGVNMATTALNGGGFRDVAMAGLPQPTMRNLADRMTGDALSYEAQTTPGQYAGTVGEFTPGGIAAKSPVILGVIPGLASEYAGQRMEGSPYEPAARLAAGMVAPLAANALRNPGAVARAMYGTGAPPPSAERQAAAALLAREGVPMTAGQRLGDTNILRREMLTGPGQAIQRQQEEAFTRAILRTIGETGTRATPEVLDTARARIGSVFDDVQRGVDIQADVPFAQKAQSVAAEYADSVAAQVPAVGRVYTEILDAATRPTNTGAIPASDVLRWRSVLGRLTQSDDAATRQAAHAMQEVLDDGLTDALTAAGRTNDVARLAEARQQYRNFLAVIKAATGAEREGLLSPASIANAVKVQDRTAYATGQRGEIADISRAGATVIPRAGTSGTPEGSRAQGIPGMLAATTGAGLASSLDLGTLGTVATTAAAMLAPAAFRRMGMTPPVQNALLNTGGPRLVPNGYPNVLMGFAAQ